MKRRQALTLLETVVSVQILFVVALFCMAMFGQGQRHDLRARQFSTCCFLANRTMQELTCLPRAELSRRLGQGETRPYDGELADYSYQATLSPYEDGLGHLEVVARSRLGCVARCSLILSLDSEGVGLTLDPYTNRVTLANGGASLRGWDDGSNTQLAATADHPEGTLLGAVTGAPGSNFLWTLGPLGTLRGWAESGNPAWRNAAALNPAVTSSAGTTLGPRWHSLASDRYTGLVVASDQANRCLWLYDSDFGWVEVPLRPRETNPLGTPGAVIMDPYGSVVWVVDRDHNCIRRMLIGNSLPAGYTAANFDSQVVGGGRWTISWDRRSFRPTSEYLGTPQGIAMDEHGDSLFVLDRAGIWRFRESDGANAWTREAFVSSGLRASGLATDRFGSLFYLGTSMGGLIKVVPRTGQPTNPTVTTLF